MTQRLLPLVVVGTICSCSADLGGTIDESAINRRPSASPACVKIEGSDLGRAPLPVGVANISVSITSWTEKVDAPGELIGFSYSVSPDGSADSAVKAGNE